MRRTKAATHHCTHCHPPTAGALVLPRQPLQPPELMPLVSSPLALALSVASHLISTFLFLLILIHIQQPCPRPARKPFRTQCRRPPVVHLSSIFTMAARISPQRLSSGLGRADALRAFVAYALIGESTLISRQPDITRPSPHLTTRSLSTDLAQALQTSSCPASSSPVHISSFPTLAQLSSSLRPSPPWPPSSSSHSSSTMSLTGYGPSQSPPFGLSPVSSHGPRLRTLRHPSGSSSSPSPLPPQP